MAFPRLVKLSPLGDEYRNSSRSSTSESFRSCHKFFLGAWNVVASVVVELEIPSDAGVEPWFRSGRPVRKIKIRNMNDEEKPNHHLFGTAIPNTST